MLLLIFNLSYLKFDVSLNNTRKKKNRDSFSMLVMKEICLIKAKKSTLKKKVVCTLYSMIALATSNSTN